ncbi:uncharacterized protein J3D65DRAFT_104035 [Phyllosticta citribraziliensis]|uniref:Uncharacterized protein n=1 Tax=Phyllosticta citribraziliensis TaxID=989973 RepID=A0ABR1LCP9_9PEZI
MMEKRSHNNNYYHLASRFPNISPLPTESFLLAERYMATSQILLLMRCRRRRKRPRSTAHRQHTGRRRRPRRGIVTCCSRWLSVASGATPPTTTRHRQTATPPRVHTHASLHRAAVVARNVPSASALAVQATLRSALFARRSASLLSVACLPVARGRHRYHHLFHLLPLLAPRCSILLCVAACLLDAQANHANQVRPGQAGQPPNQLDARVWSGLVWYDPSIHRLSCFLLDLYFRHVRTTHYAPPTHARSQRIFFSRISHRLKRDDGDEDADADDEADGGGRGGAEREVCG